MEGFPILHTERLVLRHLEAGDAEDLFQLRRHPEVNRYIAREACRSREEAAEKIASLRAGQSQGKLLYWAIGLRGEYRLVGTICLWNFTEDGGRAELGYELLPDYQGQGLMTEAILRVVEYGVEQLGLTSMEAFTHGENLASRKLLEKLGFEVEEGRTDPKVPTNVIYVRELIGG